MNVPAIWPETGEAARGGEQPRVSDEENEKEKERDGAHGALAGMCLARHN